MGTHWNRLIEAIPTITHKICFGAKITKRILNYDLNITFSGAKNESKQMHVADCEKL